jgi:hypothetical protein
MRVGQAMGLRNNDLSRGNSAILGQVPMGNNRFSLPVAGY